MRSINNKPIMNEELQRFERWYPNHVPYNTPSQCEKMWEIRMEMEIERNQKKEQEEKESI